MSNGAISCKPGGPNQSPFHFFNFNVRSVALSLVGGALGVPVFPLAGLQGVVQFQGMSVGIVGMTLSTSLLNQTALDTVAVVAALNSGPQLSINGASGIFLTHIVRQNATIAARFASSRSNAIAMGEQSAYRLDSTQSIGLYVSSAAVAGNEISATLSVYWTPIPAGL